MKTEKYENLEHELTNLQDVLKESLQNDVLQIKRLIKDSDKFKKLSDNICNLVNAEYVIYSKYMTKELHDSEYYIFIDKIGNTICRASGKEMSLYNMIADTDNLIETKKSDAYID